MRVQQARHVQWVVGQAGRGQVEERGSRPERQWEEQVKWVNAR